MMRHPDQECRYCDRSVLAGTDLCDVHQGRQPARRPDDRDTEIVSLRAEVARLAAEYDRVCGDADRFAAERDARPAITREDAALHEAWLSLPHGEDEPIAMRNAVDRVDAALRAHARGER